MSSAAAKKAVTKRPSAPAAAVPDLATCINALERVLRGQLDGYRRLLSLIERQRKAIRTANPPALDQAAQEQEALVRTQATIDGQRTQLIAAVQRIVEPGAARDALTLSQLLERAAVAEDQRTRMLTLAADLRDAIRNAKRGGGIVRDAANALARHMAGIQQTVHSALSRARVYERRGRLNLGSAMPAAVDMKS